MFRVKKMLHCYPANRKHVPGMRNSSSARRKRLSRKILTTTDTEIEHGTEASVSIGAWNPPNSTAHEKIDKERATRSVTMLQVRKHEVQKRHHVAFITTMAVFRESHTNNNTILPPASPFSTPRGGISRSGSSHFTLIRSLIFLGKIGLLIGNMLHSSKGGL